MLLAIERRFLGKRSGRRGGSQRRRPTWHSTSTMRTAFYLMLSVDLNHPASNFEGQFDGLPTTTTILGRVPRESFYLVSNVRPAETIHIYQN
jgi:hypothetical protein